MRTRVVLDANIFVSALIKPISPPGYTLRLLLENSNYGLVISDEILEELKRVIFYPKVRKYIKKSDQDIQMLLDAVVVDAFLSMPRFSYAKIVEADPDDDKYIIAALESGATYLVSGDRHLLDLGEYQSVKILSAIEFIKLNHR